MGGLELVDERGLQFRHLAERVDGDFERWFGHDELDTSLWDVAWDGDTPILVVNLDGAFYALEDKCSHEDYELSAGAMVADADRQLIGIPIQHHFQALGAGVCGVVQQIRHDLDQTGVVGVDHQGPGLSDFLSDPDVYIQDLVEEPLLPCLSFIPAGVPHVALVELTGLAIHRYCVPCARNLYDWPR